MKKLFRLLGVLVVIAASSLVAHGEKIEEVIVNESGYIFPISDFQIIETNDKATLLAYREESMKALRSPGTEVLICGNFRIEDPKWFHYKKIRDCEKAVTYSEDSKIGFFIKNINKTPQEEEVFNMFLVFLFAGSFFMFTLGSTIYSKEDTCMSILALPSAFFLAAAGVMAFLFFHDKVVAIPAIIGALSALVAAREKWAKDYFSKIAAAVYISSVISALLYIF